MLDSNLDFEGTRAELREQVVIPDFPGVERAGRLRRRQRSWTAAAVVALAVAVPAAGWVAVGSGKGGQELQAAAFALTEPTDVIDQVALDDKRSYALLANRSGTGGESPGLPQAIAHTSDGGKTWDAWRLPEDISGRMNRKPLVAKSGMPSGEPGSTGSAGPSGSVGPSGDPDPSGSADPSGSPEPAVSASLRNCRAATGMDPCTGTMLLIGRLNALVVLGPSSVMIMDWLSADGGRTWRKVPGEVGRAVDAVPDGWPLLSSGGEIWTVDPVSGAYHPLSRQPAKSNLVRLVPGTPIRPAEDGSYWVVMESAPGPTVVAVSRDRGRTWTTRKLADRLVSTSVSSADGRTGYVVAVNQANGKPAGWRTADGGVSWTGPYEVTGVRVPTGLAVFPDGSLLGLDIGAPLGSGNALTSRDGKAFTVRPDVGIAGSTDSLGTTLTGGYTVQGHSGNSIRLWYSPDGKTFTAVPIPPNSK